MKNFKGFALGLVLGIGLAVSGLGFAQSADQKTKSDSCCATASCCKGDSCDMKEHKDHASMKGGCCCCGDSCDMKMHDMQEKPKS